MSTGGRRIDAEMMISRFIGRPLVCLFVCVGPRIPDGIPVMGCPLRDLTSSPEVHVPLYQTLLVEFRHGRKAWDIYGRDPTASSILTPQ